jgi:hypothetical protein
MRLYGLIDKFPLWAIFIITTAAFLLSYEFGFRAGRWRGAKRVHEHEVVVRSMVGAMAGLLTFMLAFTFWIAATHYDASRQALLNEANAIKTTFLRADFFNEPHRSHLRNLLRAYLDVRLEAAVTNDITSLIPRSQELQGRLWDEAVAARETSSSPVFAGYFIQSLNEMVNFQLRRYAIRQEFRIPDVIWVVLYVIALLAVASLGCHAGLTSATRPLVFPAYVLLFSIALILILDLDRPLWGALKLSPQSLVELRKTMGVMEPGSENR